MLMHEVMNKQLLCHFYYGHNLYFYIPMQYSHLWGMSTKQPYRSYLPKTEYTIRRYWNFLSNISALVMLIKLYYDLETCGIIIVRQVWYIRIFIIRVSAFFYYCFSIKLLLTKVISVCLVTTLSVFTLKKTITELSSLWRNECRYFHVRCILQHKEYDEGKMEYKSRYYKTNLHICPNRC